MTPAEIRRLEAEADHLLKEDAKGRCRECNRTRREHGNDHQFESFIKPNGRGFSDYARSTGITTRKTLETTYAHEAVGFDERQLGDLGHPAGLDGGIGSIQDRSRRHTTQSRPPEG